MYIKSERAKATWYNGCGGPPVCDYDAEIEVNDNNEIIYINASDWSDGLIFTARHESIYDELGTEAIFNGKPIENIEEFDNYKDTQNSKYAQFYKIAKRMVSDLAKSYK